MTRQLLLRALRSVGEREPLDYGAVTATPIRQSDKRPPDRRKPVLRRHDGGRMVDWTTSPRRSCVGRCGSREILPIEVTSRVVQAVARWFFGQALHQNSASLHNATVKTALLHIRSISTLCQLCVVCAFWLACWAALPFSRRVCRRSRLAPHLRSVAPRRRRRRPSRAITALIARRGHASRRWQAACRVAWPRRRFSAWRVFPCRRFQPQRLLVSVRRPPYTAGHHRPISSHPGSDFPIIVGA